MSTLLSATVVAQWNLHLLAQGGGLQAAIHSVEQIVELTSSSFARGFITAGHVEVSCPNFKTKGGGANHEDITLWTKEFLMALYMPNLSVIE